MPVYNEAASIGPVVAEWVTELARLGIDYELLVLDDGSSDGTTDVLRDLAAKYPGLQVSRHENAGHGSTILRGYRRSRGDWVLQVDSDGEIPAASFEDLWSRREPYDLVIGRRMDRSAPAVRRAITWVSRLSVRLLFGPGIRDVNVPYRLMRGPVLRELASALPGDLFAPNIILSGLAIRRGLRICERPVPHVGRRHGGGSLGGMRVVRAAMRAFAQTLAAARRSTHS